MFADIDWTSVAGAGVTAVLSILATLGTAGKYLLEYLAKRDKEYREESAKMVETLVEIQKSTIDAVSNLTSKVETLGNAIHELRTEVARKADKP